MAGCVPFKVKSLQKNVGGVILVSLLEQYAKKCVIMVKERNADGAGGWIPAPWTDGAEFVNRMAIDTSTVDRVAENQEVASNYYGLIDKDVRLKFGDYFKDTSSGNVFRVTNNPDEKQSPNSASFSLKHITFERTELPE